MPVRRALVLIAVLMALTALAAGLSPREDPARTGGGAKAPAPPAVVQDAPEAGDVNGATDRTGDVLVRTLVAERPRERPIVVEEGETIRLRVRGEQPDLVRIEGLDRADALSPEAGARFEIYADRPGTFPVVLEQAAVVVGRLEVRPAP